MCNGIPFICSLGPDDFITVNDHQLYRLNEDDSLNKTLKLINSSRKYSFKGEMHFICQSLQTKKVLSQSDAIIELPPNESKSFEIKLNATFDPIKTDFIYQDRMTKMKFHKIDTIPFVLN